MNDEFNYFNYFTEIEEHFQRARGTSLFLLSPIDWALIETWKNSDIPIEAVLRGIDAAFEKWRSRKVKTQAVNSLAYCAQAVLAEAERAAGAPQASGAPKSVAFPEEELRSFLSANAAQIRATGQPAYAEVADSLDQILGDLELITQSYVALEELETRLTVLQGKLIANARAQESEESALAARRELENSLRPYRSKMTAPQLAMLEVQFLDRQTLDRARLPHLSLFYIR